MNKIIGVLKRIDLPGGVWLGLFSFAALIICIDSYISGRKIPSEFVTIFGLVLGAYATSKTIQKLGE